MLCAAGKFQIDTSTGNADDSKCTGMCPAGTFSNDKGLASKSRCKNCLADTFTKEEGLTVCQACGSDQKGEFGTGSTKCVSISDTCGPGEFIDATSSIAPCSPCPVGKRGIADANGTLRVCLECGAGYSNDVPGAVVCKRCGGDMITGTSDGGLVTNATVCKECNDGEYADAAHVACLTCSAGMYRRLEDFADSSKGSMCGECPSRGLACQNGVLNFSPDGSTKWWYSFTDNPVISASTVLHECFNDECCLYDANSDVAVNGKSMLSCNVTKGYGGPLCGACDRDNEHGAGSFTRSGRRCAECWSPAGSWFAFIGLGLLVLVAITYLVAQHSFDSYIGEYGATVQKIAFSFTQMLGVLGIFKARGTKVFNEVMARPAEVVGGSFTSMVPVKCALNSQIYGPFLLNMALPPILIATAALLLVPKTIAEIYVRKGRNAMQPSDAPPYKGKYNMPRFIAGRMPCRKARKAMNPDDVAEWLDRFHPGQRLAGVTVFVLFGFYPTLVASIASIFNCTEEINGVSYLVADLTVKCYEGWHNGFIVFAIIAAVVYAIGIPVMIVFVTAMKSPFSFGKHSKGAACKMPRIVCARRDAAKYFKGDVRRRFAFLYHGYATDRAGYIVAWEAVVCARKLAVTLAGSIFKDPYLQILSALLVLVTSFGMTAYVQPYETNWLNLLDAMGLFALIVTQILSIVYFYAATAVHPFMDPGAIEVVTTTLLFFLNVVVMMTFLGFWMSEMGNLRDTLRTKQSDVLKVVKGDDEVAPPRAALWAHPAGVAVSTPPTRAYEADGTATNRWMWSTEYHQGEGGSRLPLSDQDDGDASGKLEPPVASPLRRLASSMAMSIGDRAETLRLVGPAMSIDDPSMLVLVDSVDALEVDDVYYWANNKTRALSAPHTKLRDVGPVR